MFGFWKGLFVLTRVGTGRYGCLQWGRRVGLEGLLAVRVVVDFPVIGAVLGGRKAFV